ncbi:MAG: DHHA1 domain-containing protein [Desulfovibrionaceae bacterium]|nr:DHHA1 domain-containing protein [Desulfovibrionaceae bacterium]
MIACQTLITCHANADFDALAALVAAGHLYPDSMLLFPGSQEKRVQRLMESMPPGRHPFVNRQQVDWDSVRLLVVVDTARRARLDHVRPLLDRPGMDIHVWDHHPPAADDVPASFRMQEEAGSCTTLLVRRLRARGKTVPADSATLMGLGIYGDTGCFTFSSTGAEDFQAAAWLHTQGMDVGAIAEAAMPEVSSIHVQALNALLESAQRIRVGSTEVVLAAAPLEEYIGDFAQLAQRLMEMEKAEVLFAVGGMEDRVQVVGRSRSDAIDVGAICARLGGGGHAYAAAASVRDLTLNQVRDAIYQDLYAQAGTQKLARDYMSAPAIGIEACRSVREADELMLHFGLKAVPVFAPGTRRCVGIFDAQTASRATSHGLGEEAVETYMQRRPVTIAPDSRLQSIMDTIIGARQRLVPVVENGEVSGVVTRTDLINIFAEGAAAPTPEAALRKERSLAKLMQTRLPAATRRLLTRAGALGDRLDMPVYAVGGFVRDLLMERPNLDVDLVVEGDGIAFARALAKELGGRLRAHQKFLTAVVIWTDEQGKEQHVDVATARLEYYEYPAALPTVELSSIKMDLFRRDFTVNALAVRLSHGSFGRLADFFGGQNDIRKKAIRVLHALSFVEDPTRCLRAVRFEQRYGFTIGPGTEKLFRNALKLGLMDRLSGSRLFHELRRICEEENPPACLIRLHHLGLLSAVTPHLALTPEKTELLQSLREIMDWYRLLYFEEEPCPWLVYLLGLCRALSYPDAAAALDRLGLPDSRRQEFLSLREQLRRRLPGVEAWQRHADAGGPARKSALCALLDGLPLEGLLYLMARAEDEGLRRNLSRHITQWRRERCDISGADILALGAPAGPRVGAVLRAVLAAKIDGEAPTRDAQLLRATQLLRRAPTPDASPAVEK